MIDYIKKAFVELLEQNKWMDERTKKAAALKLESMERKVGAPIKWESELHTPAWLFASVVCRV